MSSIQFNSGLATTRDPGYAAPRTFLDGSASSTIFVPEAAPIWVVSADVQAGSLLRWTADQSDEAIFVVEGSLAVDGIVCPAGGVVLVDSSVACQATTEVDTRLLHFGSHASGPPVDGPYGRVQVDGHKVQIIPPEGRYEYIREDRETRFFVDGSQPTSRIALFLTGCEGPLVHSAHSHSASEIFVVTKGEVYFGRRCLSKGMAIYVAGGQRYSFRGNEGGHQLLNFRADASWIDTLSGDQPRLEGSTWPGVVPVGGSAQAVSSGG